VDTSNRYGLVEPLLVEYHGTSKPYPVSLPVKTITTKDRFAILEPFILPNEGYYRGNQPRSLDKPLPTITASHGAGKIVTGIAGSAKLDIRFRMLKNHELKRAQGFPEDYIILGNTTEQTKQIGNAVPVNTAKALSGAAMRMDRL
jgi:DNA (cytosine-5)-methyltransferase 1